MGGTPLASSTKAASAINTGTLNEFEFATPADLTAGTTYYIRVYRSGSRDLLNYVDVRGGGTEYVDGDGYSKDSGSWATDGADARMVFHNDGYLEDIETDPGDGLDELPLFGAEQTICSIAGADLGITEEWLALGSARVGVGSTGVNYNYELRGAHDASIQDSLGGADEEGEDTSELRMVGLVGRHKAVTSNVDLIIAAWEDASNGNMMNRGGYLIALKASLFADFEWSALLSNTSDFTTETTIRSVGPYTPSVNGNHLIIGKAEANIGSALLTMHLEDGTTETRSGDSTSTHNQRWDTNKDREPAFTMQRISISAEKTYNLRATFTATESVEDPWLLVLNLNLAGVADTIYPPFPRRKLTTVRM